LPPTTRWRRSTTRWARSTASVPAFQAVGKLFASVAGGRGDAKGKAAILGAMIAIAVVVLALSAGVILTAVLIHRYAGTVPLPAAAAAAAPRTA
jgi:glycerol-3-phosphate acyltransferase PlsY